jgi:benzodiazapine receptor
VFPVAWTTLYASMGYASYLATKALQSGDVSVRPRAYQGLVLYWGQLALNLAWTPLFFGLKQVTLFTVSVILV